MDVQAQTIGSAPPRFRARRTLCGHGTGFTQENSRTTHDGRARQTCPSHRRGRIGIRGEADVELIGDATEEIKRLCEQLIECDDEIRDLGYRMHLRGYNPTLW